MPRNRSPHSRALAAARRRTARLQMVADLNDLFIELQEDINPPHPPPAGRYQAPPRNACQRAEDDLGDLFTQIHGSSFLNLIEVFIRLVRKALNGTFQGEHFTLWNELIQSTYDGNDFSEDELRVIDQMIFSSNY